MKYIFTLIFLFISTFPVYSSIRIFHSINILSIHNSMPVTVESFTDSQFHPLSGSKILTPYKSESVQPDELLEIVGYKLGHIEDGIYSIRYCCEYSPGRRIVQDIRGVLYDLYSQESIEYLEFTGLKSDLDKLKFSFDLLRKDKRISELLSYNNFAEYIEVSLEEPSSSVDSFSRVLDRYNLQCLYDNMFGYLYFIGFLCFTALLHIGLYKIEDRSSSLVFSFVVTMLFGLIIFTNFASSLFFGSEATFVVCIIMFFQALLVFINSLSRE